MLEVLEVRHLVAVVLGACVALGSPRAAIAVQDDLVGLVDIGGDRRMYLECRGTGSPTVVLEAGYRSSARSWSEDFRQSGAPRTMVFARVAAFARVCAYDRPGTVAPPNDNVRPSRSDPIPQPRTAPDAVADLHVLLRAAGVPGPYVLVGQSLGGLFVRLYTSTYPGEVVGLILVDAYSEKIETLLTPERWAALVRLNVRFAQAQQGTPAASALPARGEFIIRNGLVLTMDAALGDIPGATLPENVYRGELEAARSMGIPVTVHRSDSVV
jgi:pimeloyl-ACP methyl ester carboxylesterase